MLLQTLLNDCYKFPGFRYGKIIFNKKAKKITVWIKHKKRSKGKCSECLTTSPRNNYQKVRYFKFISFWGYTIRFAYKPRRIICKKHGVITEYMPWSNGKSPITRAFSLVIANLAKKLSWKETAEFYNISWHYVFTSVKDVVDYGLNNRCLDNIKAIGIDEVKFKYGYKFATLVYEISEGSKRLLWIGEDRTTKTLLRFFRMLGKERYKGISVACSDMWKPYLKVIKKKIPHAIQILDRFHIVKKFNEAIDETRRQEVKELAVNGQAELLKNTRWSLLKKPENLTPTQTQKISTLVYMNLKSFKVRLLRESFQRFWSYSSKAWARKFMYDWCFIAMRSKIEPIKKVAKMLRRHEKNILNWFDVTPRMSNGVVEGFNTKVKLVMRKAYGFKTFGAFEIALYHSMGNLPEPKLSHQFY